MPELMETIAAIAREAGRVQLARFGQTHRVEFKGAIDLVTEVDRECEALIVSRLTEQFPDDAILAEESAARPGTSGRRWIVDPLDGTVNYAHGFPFFCASIALEVEGELAAAATYDPNRDELFTAERGKGAALNGRPIHTSSTALLSEALVATGFAYNVHEEDRLDNLDHFGNFVKRAQAVRRPGSAAIDLAWTACGRIDGFWELFLKPWDWAAGTLLIREAGGRVTAFDGGAFDLEGPQILASNGHLHEQMIAVLRKGARPM
jgi:myo-inositol-1(or 4)-monophosphatase